MRYKTVWLAAILVAFTLFATVNKHSEAVDTRSQKLGLDVQRLKRIPGFAEQHALKANARGLDTSYWYQIRPRKCFFALPRSFNVPGSAACFSQAIVREGAAIHVSSVSRQHFELIGFSGKSERTLVLEESGRVHSANLSESVYTLRLLSRPTALVTHSKGRARRWSLQ